MRYTLDKRHNGTIRGYETTELLDGVSVKITKSGRPITGSYYGVQHPRVSVNNWQRKEFASLTAAKEYVKELFKGAN
jgi:hypothetical protein